MAKIAVSQLEYRPGGKAIWVHGPKGTTVLRIQCSGTITVLEREVLHPSADLHVVGDIIIFKPKRKKKG